MPKKHRQVKHTISRRRTKYYLLDVLDATTGEVAYRFPRATEDEFVGLWLQIADDLAEVDADPMSPKRAIMGIAPEESVASSVEDVMAALEELIKNGWVRVTVMTR